MKIFLKYGFCLLLCIAITGISNTYRKQSAKADLIITDVKFKIFYDGQPFRSKNTHEENMHIDPIDIKSPPMVLFYLTIKNIGHADFAHAFYIAYTNEIHDIDMSRYSHAMRVSDGKDIIKVNDTLVVMVGDLYSKYQNHYKFLIQSNIDPYTGYAYPKEQEDNEENDDNNSYEITFSNFK